MFYIDITLNSMLRYLYVQQNIQYLYYDKKTVINFNNLTIDDFRIINHIILNPSNCIVNFKFHRTNEYSSAHSAGVTAAQVWSHTQRQPEPFDLSVDTHSELRHFSRQRTAVVDVNSKHGAATPRLISSHPPRPWKGLGKAGRLPSATAEVKRLQQCWGCQSIGILLVSAVHSTHGISTDGSGVESVS